MLSYWQAPPLRQLQTRRMGVNRELVSSSLTLTVSWTGCAVRGVHVRRPSPGAESMWMVSQWCKSCIHSNIVGYLKGHTIFLLCYFVYNVIFNDVFSKSSISYCAASVSCILSACECLSLCDQSTDSALQKALTAGSPSH